MNSGRLRGVTLWQAVWPKVPQPEANMPQGSVELYPDGGGDLLDSGTLVNGEVELSAVLPSGAPVVKATFVPDAGFYGSFTTEQQYVAGVSSTTSLDVDATSEYGDTLTLVPGSLINPSFAAACTIASLPTIVR